MGCVYKILNPALVSFVKNNVYSLDNKAKNSKYDKEAWFLVFMSEYYPHIQGGKKNSNFQKTITSADY